MLRLRDIMTTELLTFSPETSVRDAMESLAAKHVSGAPVVAGTKVVGVVSYGKGSVQNWVAISNEQGAVRVTIARWLTPNNRQIDGEGLTPDVFVERTAEDRRADRDPQLDAAVEVLMSMINGQPIPTSAPTSTPTALP